MFLYTYYYLFFHEKRLNPPHGRGLWIMNDEFLPGSVLFRPPDFEKIRKAGLSAVDMHFHTSHSDSWTPVKDALRLARKKGVGVAITDHNEVAGVLEAARSKEDVFLIPGIEIGAADGPHILAYFYSVPDLVDFFRMHIEPSRLNGPLLPICLSTREILEKLGDYCCVTAAAHPCDYILFNRGIMSLLNGGEIEPGILRYIDAYEVICGSMGRGPNLEAAGWARRASMGICGGTDGHMLHDLGNVVTCSFGHDPDDFLDSVAGLETLVIGREKSLPGKAIMGACVLPFYVRHAVPSIRIQYRQNLPRITKFITGLGR